MSTETAMILGLGVTLVTAIATIISFIRDVRPDVRVLRGELHRVLQGEIYIEAIFRLRWKDVLRYVTAFLVDVVFLIIWLLLQRLVGELIINKWQVTGIDKWVLPAFQILFGVSTLLPVVVYVYVDLCTTLVDADHLRQPEGFSLDMIAVPLLGSAVIIASWRAGISAYFSLLMRRIIADMPAHMKQAIMATLLAIGCCIILLLVFWARHLPPYWLRLLILTGAFIVFSLLGYKLAAVVERSMRLHRAPALARYGAPIMIAIIFLCVISVSANALLPNRPLASLLPWSKPTPTPSVFWGGGGGGGDR